MDALGRVCRVVSINLLAVLAACGGGDAVPDAQLAQPMAISSAQAALASWSAVTKLPLVPAAGALLPNGKVLFWAGEDRFNATFTGRGLTYTSLYDPADGSATDRKVDETGHDMFCPGTTNLPDGRILVNGGLDAAKTSLYDWAGDSWSSGGDMVIPRGYQANTLLSDGSVFTLGGSWNLPYGGKHGEVWTAAGGWRRLSGVPVDAMLGNDPNFLYGNDSHQWLIPAANGRVLYAGPVAQMQWISTTGSGSVAPAGPRGDDEFSLNGSIVMYDAGKILKAGGSTSYNERNANANSYVIDLSSGAAAVRKVASMKWARTFANAVVLPNGQVVVIGGQTYGQGYTDNNAVLAPELFDPATETWTALPPMATPRTYHSIALLLPDARVLAGGGGLCGSCSTNHDDLEILAPHYLFNADGSAAPRPAILSAPASVGYGTAAAVTTSGAVSSFALVRLGSVTHTINHDQRRLALAHTAQGPGAYTLQIPSNPGLLLPGWWMLFAIDAQGTPSVAKLLRVDGSAAPRLEPLADQTGNTGTAASLLPQALDPGGATLQFSAAGLPPGLAIDAATGRISGTPGTAGRYLVTLSAANATQKSSTEFVWTLGSPAATTWTRCATEGGTCSFSGTRTVRYGANGSYATRSATGSIACTNAVFGDPLPGVPKACDWGDGSGGTGGTGGGTTGTWVRCAGEGQTCSFSGTKTVRFGANGSYATRSATGSILCSTSIFGDPVYGVAKQCDYQDSGTAPASAAAAPTFAPPAGSYGSAQSVALASATAGASIYYTTNGATPTASSALYGGPIAIGATTTLQAIAVAPGLANSGVASAAYTITAGGGAGGSGSWIRCAGEGQTCAFSGTRQVRFGASGAYATRTATGSILCSNSIFGDPIYGVAKQCDYQDSTSAPTTTATPAFSLAAGSYSGPQTVALSSATTGASIFYSVNGTLPTPASTPYSGPLAISTTTTVQALATAPGLANSAVASATYTIGAAGAAWTRCAYEGQTCSFAGTKTVRFGANGSYATRTATGSIVCSNGVFGDPLYGVPKACDYQ